MAKDFTTFWSMEFCFWVVFNSVFYISNAFASRLTWIVSKAKEDSISGMISKTKSNDKHIWLLIYGRDRDAGSARPYLWKASPIKLWIKKLNHVFTQEWCHTTWLATPRSPRSVNGINFAPPVLCSNKRQYFILQKLRTISSYKDFTIGQPEKSVSLFPWLQLWYFRSDVVHKRSTSQSPKAMHTGRIQ